MLATIQRWGNSQGVRLPRKLLEEVNLSAGEEVEIKVEEARITIARAVKQPDRRNIAELFSGYDGEYAQVEFDWGKPVGKEIW